MERKISPSMIVALIALVFSMAGTGIAASRLLITNIGQIKPSVRAQLRGPEGLRGELGLQGPIGLPGPGGPEGRIGKTGAAGAQGATGATGPAFSSEHVIREYTVDAKSCQNGGPCNVPEELEVPNSTAIAGCPVGDAITGGGVVGVVNGQITGKDSRAEGFQTNLGGVFWAEEGTANTTHPQLHLTAWVEAICTKE